MPLDHGTDLYSVTEIRSITMVMINLWRNKLKNLILLITVIQKFSSFTEKIFDKGFTDLSDKPFNNLVYDETNSSLLKLKLCQSTV